MDALKIEHILIRFGEMSTKKKNRRLFVRTLIDNIKARCFDYPNITLKDHFDRIVLILNDEPSDEVMEALKDVFGIASFTPIWSCKSQLEDMAALSLRIMEGLEPTTFKVEARRKVKTLPFVSDDIHRAIAKPILLTTAHKVDIHNPVIRIKVEAGPNVTHIGIQTILGRAGLPVGVGGKALVLMSGGIDSPVAAYQMMKRGVQVEAIHFATPPYTSLQSLEKVRSLLRQLTRFQPSIPLHIVDFTAVQMELYRPIDKRYGITLMRRAFVKIANQVAKDIKALALVTGDSIGQVASQTLESLATIEAVSHIPVLRPLLTFDKVEIIDLAQKIKTFDISIQPFEDCCSLFAVNEPKTKPRIYFTELEEAKCNGLDELMDAAKQNCTHEVITNR